MLRRGSPPFLECSTRGDKRFSAFCARPRSLNGRSIEEAYQAMKIFPCHACRKSPMSDCLRCGGTGSATGLHWRMAKGQKAENADACAAAYRQWWEEWVAEQNLLPVLKAASGLSDMFGREGSVCQAAILWDIRNR